MEQMSTPSHKRY